MTSLPEKIGKYSIVGLAGRGNMGTVYLGYDPFADRDVAIKVCTLTTQLEDGPARRARKLFFNEAHTAGALDHPYILKLLDAGEDSGQPYIVMEYVDGGATLARHCSPDSLLPVPRVAEYISNCAAALDYAHRRGVIHRDIKPTNIMLTPDGEVKVGDFGIAQRTLDDTTHVMGMMGTPRYMSPEQLHDRTLTGQTDLYSLGVVMFELLTGRPPWSSTNLGTLLKQIDDEDAPALESLRPELPAGLDSIVRCAMEKELPYRYQSGAELAADLTALFSDIRADTAAVPDEDYRFEALRDLGFFNDLSDGELMEVVRLGGWSRLPAGRPWTPDERGTAWLVVVSGDAELVDGNRPIRPIGPGDTFGHGAGGAARIRLQARNDVALLVVRDEALQRASDGCQVRFGRAMLHALVQRLSLPGLQGGEPDGATH